MTKLRLLIKRPDRTNTCIPVTVDSTDNIGNCISSLVNHLDIPRRDSLGRTLTYTLRPLSAKQPLARTTRFAEAHLQSETRLVLELDRPQTVTPSVHPSVSTKSLASALGAEPLRKPPIVTRRTFVVGSVLTGCAVSGLFTGVATAFATRRRALPIPTAMTSIAAPSQYIPGVLQQVLLFSGHQQTVRAVSWSPDGTTVASGADDSLLLLWTLDGQIRQQIPHPTAVATLAWSPTGQRLASGSGDTVRFFDGRTATPLAPARNVHTGQVTSLAWSQSVGHPLISGSLDRQAIVWETQHYQPQAIFTGHTTAIEALSYQPGSTIVASVSQGGAIRVWHVDTLQEAHGFYQDIQRPMRAVAFAPTGNQLAVGGDDGQVRLWRNGLVCQQSVVTAQGALCADTPQHIHAHTAPVRSICWSPDAHYIATGGEDGIFAIWTATPGTAPTLVTKITHADPVVAVSWSPVHKQIAVASGKTVTIWNIQIER